MNYYIGVDVGHTKSKAGIVDAQGNLLLTVSEETPFNSEFIAPDVLWTCVSACIKKLIENSGVCSSDIKAVACSGHGNGLYALDKAGNPLPRAYAATTKIGEKSLSSWKKTGKDKELYPYLMQEVWAGQPLTILSDLKNCERTIYQSINKILLCKDFINYCLTGEIHTDYTDASASGIMNNATGSFDSQIYKLIGLEDSVNKVPPFIKSMDVAGYVTPKAAAETGLKEGTIVAGGMFDVAASLVGAGVCSDNVCGVISGTWGINAVISTKKPQKQKFLQCTRFVDGEKYLFIESAPTSSVNLEWLLKKVCCDVDYEEANRIAASFSPSDVQLIYHPYLHGDLRGAYQSGGFYNLTSKDSRETMVRAVYEGVAFGHKRQIEKLIDSDVTFDKIVFSGGATKSPFWCQLFADILGYDIYVSKINDAGIAGAAMIASVAAKEYSSYEDACRSMKEQYIVYHSNEQWKDSYLEKYRRFCEI